MSSFMESSFICCKENIIGEQFLYMLIYVCYKMMIHTKQFKFWGQYDLKKKKHIMEVSNAQQGCIWLKIQKTNIVNIIITFSK